MTAKGPVNNGWKRDGLRIFQNTGAGRILERWHILVETDTKAVFKRKPMTGRDASEKNTILSGTGFAWIIDRTSG